jgi:hypothetical protein
MTQELRVGLRIKGRVSYKLAIITSIIGGVFYVLYDDKNTTNYSVASFDMYYEIYSPDDLS